MRIKPLRSQANVIQSCIDTWLLEKAKSSKTQKIYAEVISSFRNALFEKGYDFTSDPELVAIVAHNWASTRAKGTKSSESTYQQRLSILNSFYTFALDRYRFVTSNPIAMIDGRQSMFSKGRNRSFEKRIQDTCSVAQVHNCLTNIDKSTFTGLRDYTLLVIALTTGRRLSELASIRMGDISIMNNMAVISWKNCKGGRVSTDMLSLKVTTILFNYIHSIYGSDLEALDPNMPLWYSSTRNKGEAITIRTIANIFEKHLGISKVQIARNLLVSSEKQAVSGEADNALVNEDLNVSKLFVEHMIGLMPVQAHQLSLLSEE